MFGDSNNYRLYNSSTKKVGLNVIFIDKKDEDNDIRIPLVFKTIRTENPKDDNQANDGIDDQDNIWSEDWIDDKIDWIKSQGIDELQQDKSLQDIVKPMEVEEYLNVPKEKKG